MEDGGWWFHCPAVGVDRFVMPKSKTVPDWYAEHVLFCSAVTKHRFVTKAKTTENPTPQAMPCCRKVIPYEVKLLARTIGMGNLNK